MQVSNYLLSEIYGRGVTRVFGVPGRENAHILFNEVPELEFITTRVEFTAGIMAEFTGRLTQNPQVAFCTVGPGATNMVTAASAAMLNRSPVLIVSAQLETDDRFHNLTHQCVDQRRIFEPVTKWSHELESAEDLPAVLDRAFRIMTTEPLGPVHLSIPIDLLKKTITGLAGSAPLEAAAEPIEMAPPDAAALGRVHSALVGSLRPLCLVGHEAIRARAEEQVRRLCRAWNMPLLAAANAKGILPHDDPLNIGSPSPYMEGILRYPTALADIFEEIDVILSVGYQYVDDILPKMWSRGRPKTILHVSTFSADPISAKYSPNVEVIGSIPRSLEALLELGALMKPLPGLQQLREQSQAIYCLESHNGKMTPVEVIRTINDNLEDGTFVTDIGYYRHHAILFSQPTRTRQFFTDSGLSTFGCGLPAAAAAQFVDRSRPVFLLCGDGGFHSGSGDLETVARHNLPIVIIVLNNNAFELIQRYQQYGGKGHNHGILAFRPVDFVKLAEANGIPAVHVDNAGSLRRAIKARDRIRPLLIEVPLAYHQEDKFVRSF
jgi:thiamine pyrophosphate-dependent acetolactate synthase large subunit-like protein